MDWHGCPGIEAAGTLDGDGGVSMLGIGDFGEGGFQLGIESAGDFMNRGEFGSKAEGGSLL